MLFCFFFHSCTLTTKTSTKSKTSSLILPSSSAQVKNNRTTQSPYSQNRVPVPTCSELLESNRRHECRDICEDIYRKSPEIPRVHRKECQKLSILQIERLKGLHELLEDIPDEIVWDKVTPNDFYVYLHISIEPLIYLASTYTTRETKRFLTGIIKKPEIARILKNKDDDFKILTTLFENLYVSGESGFDKNKGIYKVFLKRVDGGDKLMEVLIESGHSKTMDWFLDYINETNRDCENDTKSLACFQVYCKIGDGINSQARNKWLSFDSFRDYIEEIIEAGVNADSSKPYRWGGDYSVDDFSEDVYNWVHQFCKNGANNLTK